MASHTSYSEHWRILVYDVGTRVGTVRLRSSLAEQLSVNKQLLTHTKSQSGRKTSSVLHSRTQLSKLRLNILISTANIV